MKNRGSGGSRRRAPSPAVRHEVYGVDFSAAADAGRRIWVAAARATATGLHVTACFPARDLPGGGIRRDAAIAALRAFVASRPAAVFGLDFPFGLHEECPVPWELFLDRFAARAGADAFRRACGGPPEPRRATDIETGAPFSPVNLRLYRQTYHGMAHVLRPLVVAGEACVLPMQKPLPGRPWLVEICPASTLRRLGLPRSYKKRAHAPRRREILGALEARGVRYAPAVREAAIDDPGGDALDSVVAAFTVHEAMALPEFLALAMGHYAVEGRIFAPALHAVSPRRPG